MLSEYVNKIIAEANELTSEECGYTAEPIFEIQSKVFIACIDDRWRDEDDDMIRLEFRHDDSSYSRAEAKEYLKQYLVDNPESKSHFENWEEWETETDDLKGLWEAVTGYDSCVTMYDYKPVAYCLTRRQAEEHIETFKYRYNSPRIWVNSLYGSPELSHFFKELGMKNYR